MAQVERTCLRLTLDHKIRETSLTLTMCPIPYNKHHQYTIGGGGNGMEKIPFVVQSCKVC